MFLNVKFEPVETKLVKADFYGDWWSNTQGFVASRWNVFSVFFRESNAPWDLCDSFLMQPTSKFIIGKAFRSQTGRVALIQTQSGSMKNPCSRGHKATKRGFSTWAVFELIRHFCTLLLLCWTFTSSKNGFRLLWWDWHSGILVYRHQTQMPYVCRTGR